MRRISGAQVVAIIRGAFAAIVRKIMPTVVALAARYVRADHHAISLAQRYSIEVRILSVPADGRNRSDVLVPLNDRKFQLAAAVLRGVTLKRVLIRSADAGHRHFDQDATGSRFRQ